MRVSEKAFQRRVALAFAHLYSADDQRKIFIDHNGMELLIGLLGSSCPRQQLDGAVALCKLANKAMALSPVDAAPPSPTPQNEVCSCAISVKIAQRFTFGSIPADF